MLWSRNTIASCFEPAHFLIHFASRMHLETWRECIDEQYERNKRRGTLRSGGAADTFHWNFICGQSPGVARRFDLPCVPTRRKREIGNASRARARRSSRASRLIGIRGAARTYRDAEGQNARRKVSTTSCGTLLHLRFFFHLPRRAASSAIHPATSSF